MRRIPGSHVATEDDEVDSVGGSLRVEEGVQFEVEGNVGGNVDVQEDADVYVGGNVGGNVSVSGDGEVDVDESQVGGAVRYRD